MHRRPLASAEMDSMVYFVCTSGSYRPMRSNGDGNHGCCGPISELAGRETRSFVVRVATEDVPYSRLLNSSSVRSLEVTG